MLFVLKRFRIRGMRRILLLWLTTLETPSITYELKTFHQQQQFLQVLKIVLGQQGRLLRKFWKMIHNCL